MIEALPMLLVLFFSIVVHEYAHGYVAYRLGDPTANDAGRLTLNPISHVDLVGSIIVPLALVFSGSRFLFGWAKPVPINPMYFRQPMNGMALTGGAGPASNLLLALASALILRFAGPSLGTGIVAHMLHYGIVINVVLAVFNLMPIPPLDGSRVILPFLPEGIARFYWELEPYGMFLVIGLLVTGILGKIIVPFVTILRALFLAVAGA
ncbi:MAG: site-2 protease family protein [Candidatus Eisenbacteria bacterium]|nr:site-2 protease family protein [Candidatus Eisenbacteria bacterium]